MIKDSMNVYFSTPHPESLDERAYRTFFSSAAKEAKEIHEDLPLQVDRNFYLAFDETIDEAKEAFERYRENTELPEEEARFLDKMEFKQLSGDSRNVCY